MSHLATFQTVTDHIYDCSQSSATSTLHTLQSCPVGLFACKSFDWSGTCTELAACLLNILLCAILWSPELRQVVAHNNRGLTSANLRNKRIVLSRTVSRQVADLAHVQLFRFSNLEAFASKNKAPGNCSCSAPPILVLTSTIFFPSCRGLPVHFITDSLLLSNTHLWGIAGAPTFPAPVFASHANVTGLQARRPWGWEGSVGACIRKPCLSIEKKEQWVRLLLEQSLETWAVSSMVSSLTTGNPRKNSLDHFPSSWAKGEGNNIGPVRLKF